MDAPDSIPGNHQCDEVNDCSTLIQPLALQGLLAQNEGIHNILEEASMQAGLSAFTRMIIDLLYSFLGVVAVMWRKELRQTQPYGSRRFRRY